ncbi:VCBS repeat-containing protein [Flavihumibacter profundi]|uniref:VCBS repeat-containing protein n=1 Tax=Flavihumibacter profundi TaxID=2716883 RepID=UPI001CC50FE8|nr:VCBS repeat-containing protein [Flavihumibacter profundi]MBZ5858128.1 VCBS repeat-containing protein [Flavihumibacter profundi]
MRLAGAVFLLAIVLAGCRPTPAKKNAFSLVEDSGIRFTNTINNTTDLNIFNYRTFYNGGGCAIGDINNDGLPDVFLTANMGSNKLFLNKGGFKFEDISEKAGIGEALKWSTGVVMADVNNDGWLDIYVCNAGYQDGKLRQNALFINNKDLSFTDRAKEYGLADSGYSTQAVFFDYDLDGDLDAYILNNSLIPVNTINAASKRNLRAEDWQVPDYLKGSGNHLLRNDNGKFVDVSKEANIYSSLIGFGLGVAVGDVNGDRYPDIYISNDFFEKDYLYINQGNGTFKEDLENRIQHISHSSMGVDIGDINNDDHPDIFVTEMLPDNEIRLKTTTTFENTDIQHLKQTTGFFNQYQQNTLQVSNGNGQFLETAFYSDVAASDWSWGGLLFDADNDGLNDIYVSNGIYNNVTDQDFIDFFANDVIQKMVLTGKKEDILEIISKMPSEPIVNKMFHNKGNLQFEDVAAKWGMSTPSFSNGAAYGDLDNDGDLDLVENNVNQPAFIYRNNSRELNHNNFIGFRLKGAKQNPFAVGTLVKVFSGKDILSRELFPARGFQSSMDYTLEFGLGGKIADSVQVIWPDKTMSILQKPAINQFHTVDIASASRQWQPALTKAATYFSPLVVSGIEAHKEDDYIDFNYERNIPVMLSREGPHIAQADVNGDGKLDFYAGGAAGQPGQLYLQTGKGFQMDKQPVFENFKASEDVAVLFFDADNDKDPDLFIGSGGNRQSENNAGYAHRLYLNDGHGRFTEQPNSFPLNKMNIAVAAANDIDGDGDLDLFVGSRSVPGQYGISPRSYIYINDGKGHFTDATDRYNKNLASLGMVTDAVWADLTGDGKKELIIVGEWMSPVIYSVVNDQLAELPANFGKMNGWWQSVRVADLDKDGKNDLVLGNIGKNFYLKATADKPVKLWMNDFDGNGTVDKILTRRVDGRDMPVFMKRELNDQLPSLIKQNLKHEEYARKSIEDLFGKELVQSATVKELNECGSFVAWNEGNGKFQLGLLPLEIQLTSLNAAMVTDITGDGLPDLVTGGNLSDFQPQFGAIDAGFGHLLINDGKRSFQVVPDQKSGIMVPGITKDIVLFTIKGEKVIMYARNNETPLFFSAK